MLKTTIETISSNSDNGTHLKDALAPGMTNLYEAKGKERYHVYSTDPYGLWYITFKGKGKLPKKLESAFTTQLEAFRAIEAYEGTLK